MQLSDTDLLLLTQTAISASLKAGRFISSFNQKNLAVAQKKGGSSYASQVVTEVDHLSQAIILKALSASCSRYDMAVLTEEKTDDSSRLNKDYFWCIDPLDGTLAYIESKAGYSVSIALVSKTGVPVLGVIYDPLEHIFYHAIKNHGAYRNGKPWQPLETKQTKTRLHFISDRSFASHPAYATVVNRLQDYARQSGLEGIEIIQQGGAAKNACWVLEKQPASYFKFPTIKAGGGCFWDFAASCCLFNELDAVVTDINGNALQLNKVESLFLNHCGVLYASDRKLAEFIMNLYRDLEK